MKNKISIDEEETLEMWRKRYFAKFNRI